MSTILPKYDIEIDNDFLFLKKEGLKQFMSSGLHPHSHNYYILSFLYEGSIAHLSDFKNEQVCAPAILTLDINQVHTHPDISNCNIVSIGFSANFISDQQQQVLQKVNHIFTREYINISSDELNQLDEIIQILSKEYKKEKEDYELIKALLNVLIIQCHKLSQTYSKNIHNFDIYHQFKILLTENFRKEHQVKFYADQLNQNRRVLTRSVRISTFKTPKQLIDQQLLVEAKRLLFWSNISVREVAWELGFETDSYFNRFFKKNTGMTPLQFKKDK